MPNKFFLIFHKGLISKRIYWRVIWRGEGNRYALFLKLSLPFYQISRRIVCDRQGRLVSTTSVRDVVGGF